MIDRSLETPSYEYAESILTNDTYRQRYDETKMHWIGDPDPAMRHDGRHPWVKRLRNNQEYVYSLPVLAAFSVARDSLLSVRKDLWHSDSNPRAWFVGEHNLVTGEVYEPEILRSTVDARRHLWLQVAGRTASSRYGEQESSPRDQRRFELNLDKDYYAVRADYRAGLRLPPDDFEDIAALESMMRLISETRNLQLPFTVNPVAKAYQLAR